MRDLGFSARSSIVLALVLLALTPPALAAHASAKRDAKLPAPDFTLPTMSGTVTLHDLRGKVVYVDFWASWCAPCRQSFPWMTELSKRYGDQGLVVVAINLDKRHDAVQRFLQEHPATFPVALDPSGSIAEAFHVEAMPSSFIVNRDGTIASAHAGFDPEKTQEIEAQLKEALSK